LDIESGVRLVSGRNNRGSAEYEQVRSRVTKSGHSAPHQVDTIGSISGGANMAESIIDAVFAKERVDNCAMVVGVVLVRDVENKIFDFCDNPLCRITETNMSLDAAICNMHYVTLLCLLYSCGTSGRKRCKLG